MAIPLPSEELVTGEHMSREKFLRTWDRLPGIKHAELIDGVVYVGSPVSLDHGFWDGQIGSWLDLYWSGTPGTHWGHNVTWLMLECAPQPDVFLCVLPEHGGQARRTVGNYYAGAPELAVEITETSAQIDFGPKMALYARAGVREYITLEPYWNKLTWRSLARSSYRTLTPGPDGILRSKIFPGLWLDPDAFWNMNKRRITAVLKQGRADPAHAAFVKKLARAKR